MLSDWWLHLFNDNPVGLIPACPSINTFVPASTVANVRAMENDAVNGSWIVALITVKSEIPPLTAGCAALYANVPHVHYTKVGISLYLDEVAYLVRHKKTKKNFG